MTAESGLLRFVALPPTLSPIERRYLTRANRLGVIFLFLHLPVFVIVAWANDTDPAAAAALSALVLFGPLFAFSCVDNPRSVSVVYGVASMALGGLLVHFGRGPMQIEMHFYFLVLIAMLAIYGNPTVIIAAAFSVVAHHGICWYIARDSVFGLTAPLETVIVHAVFVVVDAVGACFIARTFFDNVISLEKIISTRTDELEAKEQDLQTILQHMDRGICLIRRDGTLARGRSATFDRLLGAPEGGTQTIFDLFARLDGNFATASKSEWRNVEDAFLPLQLTLGKMPRELQAPGRTLEISYSPVRGKARVQSFIVAVKDATEANDSVQDVPTSEIHGILRQAMAQPRELARSWDDITALVTSACDRKTAASERHDALKSLIHEARQLGADSMLRLCEQMASHCARGHEPSSSMRKRLEQSWSDLRLLLELVGPRCSTSPPG